MADADLRTLIALNERFIEAFRSGSWDLLRPVLTPAFGYLDGATGQTWALDRYQTQLRANPQPRLAIDQLVIHVDGDAATVSARTSDGPGSRNRYLDSYRRLDGQWHCHHACVWPLTDGTEQRS